MSEPNQSLETLGAAFLERHMKREQTAFVVFIGVFMLLLIGISILFIYNGMVVRDRLESLNAGSLRARFEAVGAISQARAESQSARSDLNNEVQELSHQTNASREDLGQALRAAREPADTMAPDAVRFAKAHILGWSLNDASAQLVTAARVSDTLDLPQQALLDLALADWRGDETAAQAALEVLETSPAHRGYALAGRADRLFQAANADGLNWRAGEDAGCSAVVDTVTKALAALDEASAMPADFADKGLTLNLWYFKGQCQRKNGRAEAGYQTFTAMRRVVESADVTDANTYKFQAHHGEGTTLMILADDPDQDGLPEQPLDVAITLLKRAADLRTAWGQTEVGRAGSTENISFIYLRQPGRHRWDDILEHTASVDNVTSMTWNLTARLIAAHEKAKITPASDREACQTLREIIFDTGAKLSRRPATSFARGELERLTTPAYADYVAKAMAWTDAGANITAASDAQLTAGGVDDDLTWHDRKLDDMIARALETPCEG